ncbi:MAG: regulatory iron-sulfur-containing complex subunit RicT [Chitinophagales bacterium]
MSCETKKTDGVAGCNSGGCATGGCNRNNVFDWLADMPLSFNENFNIIEIAFKNGSRKGFYRNTGNIDLCKGQLVVVEAAQGYDIGEVSLQGELVKAQMKKKRVTERDDTIRNVLRIADEQDINIYLDGRNREREVMMRARAIAKTMRLDMKVGDMEFQGDGKKLTVYYTAEGRVDFRELVKVFARDFKVKIEMRQIGARQEAARIGGVGTCGRELCCSTWLQDFKSVTTNAVRYQNLSVNSDKMSGQCGRLKCCLNYELDTYNDALKKFPRNSDVIETEEGKAILRKTEILKKQLWYSYAESPGTLFKLSIETVNELLWMNKQGKRPASLSNFSIVEEVKVDESKHDDLVGQVSLASLDEKSRRNRNQQRKSGSQGNKQQRKPENKQPSQQKGNQQRPQQQNHQQGQQQKRKPQGQPQNRPNNPQRPPQQRNGDNKNDKA